MICVCIGLLLSVSVFAQEKSGKNKDRFYSFLTKKSFQFGVGYSFWQQQVGLYQRGATGEMNVEYKGIEIIANYVKPSTKNVHWVYGINGKLTFGNAKGSAQGTINEEFDTQNFTDVQFAPTIMYRSNLKTEFGIVLPIGYRMSFWAPPTQPDIILEDENLFYFGYGLTMLTRFSLRSAIVVTLAHQHNIESSRWSLAWQYDWK